MDNGCILIRVENLSKHFYGIKALQNVSFEVKKGEIMGLAGHNGAGKSVLIKTIGGIHKPDSGSIYFNGGEVKLKSPHDAQERGYFIVPQEICLAKQMSVKDNIFMGRDDFALKGIGILKEEYANKKTKELMKEYFNIDINPKKPAGDFDVITQRLIQVIRCLSAGANVIVFDETTSGLSQIEKDMLFNQIRELAKKGIGIVFISHIISELIELCDKITILRGGQLVGVKDTEGLTTTKIIEMIVGHNINTQIKKTRSMTLDKPLLSVRNFTSKNGGVRDINFDIKKGEIVGVYGLRDQGQLSLLETIFGVIKKEKGEVELEGKIVNIKSPVDALKNGITYLPNRGPKSTFMRKSIIENIIVLTSNYKSKAFFIKRKEEQKFTEEVTKKFNIIGYKSIKDDFKSLSGGNMQKVLIARVMSQDPKILLLMEPTEGIDIGAKIEVKQLVINAAGEGKGILFVSSEIEDIMEVCSRVIIIRNGRVKLIMDCKKENTDKILEEAIG